jgi:glycosyltransferase involved in cell wall biosynthesis
MKILQVIPYFTPRRGGDVHICYSISRLLAEQGHDVTVITTDFEFDREYAKTLEILGVKIIPFNCIYNLRLFLISPGMCGWVKSQLKDFDLIHLHDLRSFQNAVIHYYAQKYNVPYILHPHGSTSRRIEKLKLKLLFDQIFGYKILRDARRVIAVSEEEAEYDRQMGANFQKVAVIYNGMDVSLFRDLPEYGKFRKKFNINGKMILYLGRIHKSKGIRFLIEAFSIASKKVKDSYLVIAGPDDGYKCEIDLLVNSLNLNDNVIITGFLDEKSKISAYVDADLFVSPVKYMGGVGLTPLEAILCGTPAIVTDECGEIFKKANAGCLVRYNDLNELSKTMEHMLEMPDEAIQNVSRIKDYIDTHLTNDKFIGKILIEYSKALS